MQEEQKAATLENKPSISLNQFVPDFQCAMTGSRTFSLHEQLGKTIVLYFYPKDNTPGCTTESMAFRDLYPQFQARGCEVFGISRDSLRSHENFKAKLELPFELLSDPEESVCSLFDVMRNKMMYGKKVRGIQRSTFVIDASGKLVKEWRDIKVAKHVDDILEFISTLPA